MVRRGASRWSGHEPATTGPRGIGGRPESGRAVLGDQARRAHDGHASVGATHDDASLWPVVAFLTALPGLDAAAYDAMLVRAAGHGHHAKAKADVISVADDDVPEAAEPAAHVHDHSGHEH